MAYQNTGTIGPEDGDALISLNPDHAPTESYIKELRSKLPQQFPGTTFSFLPADIVSQILNFGLPAPIDVQVTGNNQAANYAYATDLLKRIRAVPGIADLRIQQVFNYPQMNVDVDRTLAGEVGLTERDVANSLLITLSGSGQVRPNFWLNPKNGVSYPIVAQMPQYRIDTMSDLVNVPVTSAETKEPQYLGGLASIVPGPSPGVVSHYNVQPVIDIYGAVQGRDLGAIANDIGGILKKTRKDVPRGSYVVLSGQVRTMTSAYSQLYFGLAGAIVLIYLIIVVNFQSWLDPFIIITALPGALAGIVWMLFMTGTTLSVPALTGAIMCMGIATANSILLVSFAREALAQGLDAGKRRARSGLHPLSSGADDGAGDDYWHAADGLRFGRRRRTECAARTRRHRRTFSCDDRDPVFRPHRVHRPAFAARAPTTGRDGPVQRTHNRIHGRRRSHRQTPGAAALLAKPAPLRTYRVAAAVVIAVIGILERRGHEAEVKQWTQEQAVPTVALISAQHGAATQRMVLPGTVQAWYEAPIYARVPGYLKDWYFDYGAHVKKGDVLAEIETPDLDAQLAAAQAKLNSAQAVVVVRQAEKQFAETTYQRWRDSPKGVVSEQEQESKQADYNSAVARVRAAQAEAAADQGEVDRLQALEGFKKILAPFDGVVTARETDIGALINAGSGNNGPELFRVADIHQMRVYVQVPQQLSAGIRQGLTAELQLPQYPDKTFKATVATTSSAINMSARTLLAELHAENHNDELQPGAYAQVTFELPSDPNIVHVPTSALIFRERGTEIAVVGPDDKVELKPVKIGRNLGTQVEILSGLSPTDRVINSPPNSLGAGDKVRIAGQQSAGTDGHTDNSSAEDVTKAPEPKQH